MSGPNWRPSEDAITLLEELREAIKHWEAQIEVQNRFRGGDLDTDRKIRDIKDKLINLRFMQYLVRRNA